MKPRYNFWLESDGQVAISVWRVRLLAAIARTGSISAAARAMGVPYRVAWQKINEMETLLGEKLVDTQVGGKQGGGAVLTPLGADYVERFGRFTLEAQQYLQTRFEEIFED
jgi:molybdate transport system regulatory protein